mgnify:CR=1 FL=1
MKKIYVTVLFGALQLQASSIPSSISSSSQNSTISSATSSTSSLGEFFESDFELDDGRRIAQIGPLPETRTPAQHSLISEYADELAALEGETSPHTQKLISGYPVHNPRYIMYQGDSQDKRRS